MVRECAENMKEGTEKEEMVKDKSEGMTGDINEVVEKLEEEEMVKDKSESMREDMSEVIEGAEAEVEEAGGEVVAATIKLNNMVSSLSTEINQGLIPMQAIIIKATQEIKGRFQTEYLGVRVLKIKFWITSLQNLISILSKRFSAPRIDRIVILLKNLKGIQGQIRLGQISWKTLMTILRRR